MTGSRIVVFGDSHIDAIKRALIAEARQGSVGLPIEGFRIAKLKNEVMTGDLDFEACLTRVADWHVHDLVVSAMGGNQHSVFGLVQHPQPFDFYSRDRPDLPPLPGHEVIPYQVLWSQFETGLRGRDGTHIKRLREHTRARVVHLSPPPPKEDASHILKRHELDFAKAGILERGVSAASMRLKLWHLQLSVLQHLCAEWGVQLMPAPPESQTATGYLKPEYYADDATHANVEYGKLVLAGLRAFATSPATPQG